MLGAFKCVFRIRTSILLLICSISFSSEAELQAQYVQKNDLKKEKSVHTRAWKQVVTASNSDSIVYQLTPTLTVVTKPLGTAKNNASVTFYTGSLLLYTVTVTQASPVSVCSFNLILGTVKIEQGMQLTLQIPSSLQPGSIFLQATFSDLNVPSTTVSTMVATWNL